MHSYFTQAEADYRCNRIAEQFRNSGRRHGRPVRTHLERRWRLRHDGE